MSGRPWKRHALQAFGVLAALLALGLFSGHLFPVLFIGVGVYAAWQIFNMVRLYHWLHDESADTPESIGIWSSIFERIHRLQKLSREQHERNERVIGEFRSMTNALPDATLVLDDLDNITWFNDAAHTLLGLRTPEDIGQPVTNLIRDPEFADWLSVQEHLESAFQMFSPLDGNVRLSVTAVRYREDQSLLILRDITDLHNLEQVRRDFVANVSHELRTPLTVLLGYLESIRDTTDMELGQIVERMQDQGWQMQALLTDLLELSRLQSDARAEEDEPVNVCASLTQLGEQAEEISQGNHRIEVICQSGLGLMGNEKDLESAFRNLINNAVYYTPKGGSVRIEWKATTEGPVFSVSDTGIGIPRRDIPRLTERFYRVGADRSRHRGGTGLGLSIVKHVLNAHGAKLMIDSELGEGSEFSCVFPERRRWDMDAAAEPPGD